MKNKNIILLIIIGTAILGGVFISIKATSNNVGNKNNNNSISKNEPIESDKKELAFLKQISGIKATEVELIKNPVGIKGNFIAPRTSILNGVDYFLKNTDNEKMSDVQIDIKENYVEINTDYQVNTMITTPISVKVIPSVDENKNLVLKIKEVTVLDLKVAEWIIDLVFKNFIKDWFPSNGNMEVIFNEGSVIIPKQNFEEIILDKVYINENGLNLQMIINLEKIM